MRVGGVVVIALALVFLGLGTQRELAAVLAPGGGPGRCAAARRGLRPRHVALHRPDLRAPILALTVPLTGGGSGVARGVVLARAPTASGLGLPFLLIAARLLDAPGARRAGCAGTTAAIQVVGGVLLLAVGLLLVTGVWDDADRAAAERGWSPASRR